MTKFIPWGSQPLGVWSEKYAEGKQIEVDGHLTHFIERGSGPPVLMIHGFFLDSQMWAPNIDALAEHFHVFAMDLWGFGYSSREPMDYSYQLYADQVLGFMDALGIERASIIGQSMGGGTAMLFCIQHRSRVDKLVLVGAEDKSVPLETGRKLHNLLSTSRIEVFERAGHVPNYEEADGFNKPAVEFLE